MLLTAGCGDITHHMQMTEVCKGLDGHEWQSKAVFVMKRCKNMKKCLLGVGTDVVAQW